MMSSWGFVDRVELLWVTLNNVFGVKLKRSGLISRIGFKITLEKCLWVYLWGYHQRGTDKRDRPTLQTSDTILQLGSLSQWNGPLLFFPLLSSPLLPSFPLLSICFLPPCLLNADNIASCHNVSCLLAICTQVDELKYILLPLNFFCGVFLPTKLTNTMRLAK